MTTGKDFLHTGRYVQGIPRKLPKCKYSSGEVVIHGEFVIHAPQYAKVESDMYQNPRDFCAGMLQRKNPKKEWLRKMTFVSYRYENLSKDRVGSKWQEIQALAQLGLTTIENPSRHTKGHYALKRRAKKMNWPGLLHHLPVFDLNQRLIELLYPRPLEPKQIKKRLKWFRSHLTIPIEGVVLEVNDYAQQSKLGLEDDGTPAWARAIHS